MNKQNFKSVELIYLSQIGVKKTPSGNMKSIVHPKGKNPLVREGKWFRDREGSSRRPSAKKGELENLKLVYQKEQLKSES
jgi:hypothetical protein